MSMRWNENLHPPSGFEFIDSDNIRHVGSNLHDLISKLAAYRTRRGLPAGNPVAEVNDFLCARFPKRCLNGPARSQEAVVPSGPSLGTRITEWLRGTWMKSAQKTLAFVPEEEVKRRVAICMKCPLQAKFPTECAACAETLNHFSFHLRAGRDKESIKLKVCERFSSDLRVDVLTEQPPQPKAPDHCWKKG